MPEVEIDIPNSLMQRLERLAKTEGIQVGHLAVLMLSEIAAREKLADIAAAQIKMGINP